MKRLNLRGAHGNTLIADLHVPQSGHGPLAILAHGGGQTRHSWRGAAQALAGKGWCALTLDQRGHGDSDWIDDAAYALTDYAADLKAVGEGLEREGFSAPAVIGASLGGMAGLVAVGELGASFRALVLVDITPRVKPEGVGRILRFMQAHADRGFESLEEAAASISAYLPHRPPPADLAGLAKNLRRDGAGRYRWHWDPKFLNARADASDAWQGIEQRLSAAASRLSIPVLLVRGRESELVGEDEADAFLSLAPQAKVADVSGARHMVAGDRNDVFTGAVLDFLDGMRKPPTEHPWNKPN